MADIATLGFAVDSRPLKTASKDIQDLGTSSQKSATQLGAIEAMAKRAGVSVQEMSRRVDAASGSTQNFQRQVTALVAANDNFSNSLSRINTHANGLIGSFQGIAIAAAVSVTGIAGLASVFSKFITETAEAQRVQALLQATLNATGGSAGQTLESLNDMAKALQGVSTFSDEAVGSAQNVLLRFTNVREVFERATKASLDLASATGKDLDTAAKSVGKALEDPVRGLAALRREGVFVTEKNQELIKSLVESGDILKAQGIILGELETRYKGAAEAARNTLGGALAGLKNAFGDLFEQNGPAADKLIESINKLTAALTDPSVVAAVQAFGAAFFNELTQIISFFTQLNVEINRVKLTLGQLSSGNFASAFNFAGPRQKGLDELTVGAGKQMSTSEVNSFYDAITGGANKAAAATQKFVGVNEAWAASAKKAGDEQGKAALTALEIMKNNVTALGSAATAAETYQLKVAELVDKLQQGTISQDTFNRAVSQLDPTVSALKDAVSDVGKGLAQAFTQGADAAEALNRSLSALSAKASSKVIDKLLTGLTGGGFDLGSIATNGLIGLGAGLLSQLFGGNDDDAKAQQQAAAEAERARQEREKEIAAAQIRAADYTLRAAAAMEKSDFINRIRQFDAESQKAFDEESKRAGDVAIWQLVAARAAERTKLIADTIEEATDTLAGDELSSVQQRLQEITSAAETLGNALIETGIGAEAAAEAVDQKLNASLEKLTNTFLADLQTKVNELNGQGFVNQAGDLINEVAQLRADAAALGTDTALIDQFYVLSAQKIIDQNKLTGQSYENIVEWLGLTNAGLHEFSDTIEATAEAVKRSTAEIASTIQSNQDALFKLTQDTSTLEGALAVFDLEAQRQREAEIAAGGQALASLEALQAQQRLNIINDFNQKALQAQQDAAQKLFDEQQRANEERLRAEQQAAEERKRVIDEATKFLTGALQNIANWIQHFLAGTQSTLSPAARLASAQSSFSTQKALAIGGNRDALSGITQNAQDVIDAATAYYGSSAAGQAIISDIIAQLQTLPAQTSAEKFIVDGVTSSIQTQTSALQSALGTLQTAVASNNPTAIATALANNAVFQHIDTNTDNSITQAEFVAGLAGMASNSALVSMFTRLDTDNSGNLTKAELINQSLGGTTTTAAANTAGVKGTATSTAASASSLATATSQLTTAISNLSSIITQTGNTSTNTFNTKNSVDDVWDQQVAANNLLNSSNNILGAIQSQTGFLNSMNGLLISIDSSLVVIRSWAAGSSHAAGGYITGPGTGTSDSIPAMLSAGEGVITARRVAELGGKAWVDGINAGGLPILRSVNDNGGVVAAINSQTAAIMRGMKALIAAEFEAANIVTRPLQEQVKTNKRARAA